MPLNVKLHLKSSVEEMRPQDGTSGKRKGSMSGVLLRRLKGKKLHCKFLNQKRDKTNHSDNRMWKAAHQREMSDVHVYTLVNLCNNQRSVCLHTICRDENLRTAKSFHNYDCTHRHSSPSSLNL